MKTKLCNMLLRTKWTTATDDHYLSWLLQMNNAQSGKTHHLPFITSGCFDRCKPLGLIIAAGPVEGAFVFIHQQFVVFIWGQALSDSAILFENGDSPPLRCCVGNRFSGQKAMLLSQYVILRARFLFEMVDLYQSVTLLFEALGDSVRSSYELMYVLRSPRPLS